MGRGWNIGASARQRKCPVLYEKHYSATIDYEHFLLMLMSCLHRSVHGSSRQRRYVHSEFPLHYCLSHACSGNYLSRPTRDWFVCLSPRAKPCRYRHRLFQAFSQRRTYALRVRFDCLRTMYGRPIHRHRHEKRADDEE